MSRSEEAIGVARPHVPARAQDRASERVVDAARLAPSTCNTQPWAWRVRHDVLQLWSDPRRALPATDPDGRMALISCGVALHHAVVTAASLGLAPMVRHLPDPRQPDLIATLSLDPSPSPGLSRQPTDAGVDPAMIPQRRTDPRRFTTWPLPAQRVLSLADPVDQPGCRAVPVTDEIEHGRVAALVDAAKAARSEDPVVMAERRLWEDHGPHDGVPSAGADGHAGQDPTVLPSDGLLVLATSTDDRAAWLAAGATLSRLWLRATAEDIAVLPIADVVEHAPTREVLRTVLTVRHPVPQLVLRVGWQLPGRSDLPRTPRRPLEEVLQRG